MASPPRRPTAKPGARLRMWVGIAAAILGLGLTDALGYVGVTGLRQYMAAAAWRDFSPPGGNVKAEMPGRPRHTQQAQSVGAEQVQVHVHEVIL